MHAFKKPRLPLTLLQKDKEDLEEISSELELADEDEKVPYVCLAIFCIETFDD